MHISFTQVESVYFRNLLVYCSSILSNHLPRSHNTIRSWILREYAQCKAQMKGILAKAPGQIHLSFDLWTSSNHLALLGIVGHWPSASNRVHCALLGLRRLEGQHSGENMQQAVMDVLEDLHIPSKIGYFMLDNATTNDKCVNLLADRVFPPEQAYFNKFRRLRCIGHVLNLVVKGLLFGKDAAAFETEVQTVHELQQEERELELWRKRGPIGKLHNVVVFIRRSPQRIEEFKRLQLLDLLQEFGHLQALADNATRWNSTSNMMERALRLKDPIDLFISRHVAPQRAGEQTLADDRLLEDDWEQIKHLLRLLKPFRDLTLRLEGKGKTGSRGAVWEILPAMDLLLEHLESAKAEYEHTHEYTHVKTAINNAWLVLDKYYNLTEMSPIYVAAVVLNPKCKWQYFEKRWQERPEWIAAGRAAVKDLWETEYKGKEQVDYHASFDPTACQDQDMLDEFLNFERDPRVGAERGLVDEYEEYCAAQADFRVNDILEWWQSQAGAYPQLSRMAGDILSVPAMSAECERVFSSAKLLISDRRNKLGADVIEATECLKSWESASLIVW
jgi:hypothetical protein